MVREWTAPQHTFLVEKKLQIADRCGICSKVITQSFLLIFLKIMFILELSCFILINQVAGPYMGTRQCSSSCLKEVFVQAPQEVPAERHCERSAKAQTILP